MKLVIKKNIVAAVHTSLFSNRVYMREKLVKALTTKPSVQWSSGNVRCILMHTYTGDNSLGTKGKPMHSSQDPLGQGKH